MTTKVEPTVEKWGGDQESNKCEFCGETKPVQRYYLRVKNKHFDDNKGGCYSTFIYYCQDCGVEDTHSVQEAKADRTREIIHLLDDLEINQPEDLKTDNWRNWKYIRNSIVDKYGILTQLRTESTLNTKASLKQEN